MILFQILRYSWFAKNLIRFGDAEDKFSKTFSVYSTTKVQKIEQ